MVGSEYDALEVSPEAFYAIRGERADSELLLTVTDEYVGVFRCVNGLVCSKFIGDYDAAFIYELFNDGNKSGCLRISNLHCVHKAVLLEEHITALVALLRAPTHAHTEDRCLYLGASAQGVFRFLGRMLVGFPTAKIDFIALNNTTKVVVTITLCEQGAHLMENVPRSFLRNVYIGCQLNGGDTLLMARDKVHRKKPLAKGNLGILKDSTYGNGKVLPAVRATEGTILTDVAMMPAAVGANHIILIPTGLEERLLAFLFEEK